MNKSQILSLIIVILFLSSVFLVFMFNENTAGKNFDNNTDDNNLNNNISYNNSVILEFFVYAGICDDCDTAKEIVNTEIKPYFKDNITINEYKISAKVGEYEENSEKLHSYDLTYAPSIVVKNLSSNKTSKLTFTEITTKNYLKNEIVRHLTGNYSQSSTEKNPMIDFFGMKVDLNDFSLPVLTIVLAGIDSVNPCSFFVLLFLLSLLIYMKSRKKMILIGSVFVFFSGFIYFLLMTAVLTVIQYIGIQMIIFSIAGIIAIFFGGLNIKDFFFFKKGPSASISDEKKKGLYKQIRKIVKIKSLPSLFIASILFAISANTVDLLCSFNLPVIYTSILTSQNLAGFGYYFYILAYNIIYVIPLMVIVSIMVITLGKWKLSEFQGRVLKLFSGLMIFSLGEILLINPDILNNIMVALGLVFVCILLTFVVSFIYRFEEKPKAS